MAEIITGGRTVKTAAIPTVDFARGMRGLNSQKAMAADAHLLYNANFSLWDGRELEGDKRSSFPTGGDITLNLNNLANMPPKVLDALGTKQTQPCVFSGNTPEGTPVQVDTVKRMSEQDPQKRNCVQLQVDLQAVANVQDIMRDKARVARGEKPMITGDSRKDRNNPALGRTEVRLSAKTTDDGVPAMSQDRLAYNVGIMAAQNYLMTTPKGNPDKYMVQKDDVASVAALFAKEYKSFAETYADKECKGIKAMEKQADGTYKPGKQSIEGTAFSSLKDMGFSPVTLDDGSFALVCTDASQKAVDARTGEKGLNAFNKAFNSHMAQVVAQSFESGTVARNIAAQTSIASYPSTIPGSGITTIQPQTEFTVRSFARSVTTSIECATHQNAKPVEEIYGKQVIDNTRTIQSYFPDKGDGGDDVARSRVLDEIKAKCPEATAAKDARSVEAGGPQMG